MPRPDRICNPSSVFRTCPGVSLQLHVAEYIQGEVSKRLPDQMAELPKLAPFDAKKQWF